MCARPTNHWHPLALTMYSRRSTLGYVCTSWQCSGLRSIGNREFGHDKQHYQGLSRKKGWDAGWGLHVFVWACPATSVFDRLCCYRGARESEGKTICPGQLERHLHHPRSSHLQQLGQQIASSSLLLKSQQLGNWGDADVSL